MLFEHYIGSMIESQYICGKVREKDSVIIILGFCNTSTRIALRWQNDVALPFIDFSGLFPGKNRVSSQNLRHLSVNFDGLLKPSF